MEIVVGFGIVIIAYILFMIRNLLGDINDEIKSIRRNTDLMEIRTIIAAKRKSPYTLKSRGQNEYEQD